MSLLIETHNLCKTLGGHFVVNRINLQVERGDVYGLLGENGSGKSTTLRMLLGLVRPSSGKIALRGFQLPKYREIALRKTGAIVEAPAFYDYLSGRENLHRAEGKKNVLLTGDFNLDLTPIESSDLFTDDKKNDSEAYSLLVRRFRDLGGQAGPTTIFNRRIDYLFLASENLETVEVRVIQGKVVGRMDHLPLVGRFKVR